MRLPDRSSCKMKHLFLPELPAPYVLLKERLLPCQKDLVLISSLSLSRRDSPLSHLHENDPYIDPHQEAHLFYNLTHGFEVSKSGKYLE